MSISLTTAREIQIIAETIIKLDDNIARLSKHLEIINESILGYVEEKRCPICNQIGSHEEDCPHEE